MLQALHDAMTEALSKTSVKASGKTSVKTSDKILGELSLNSSMTIPELAEKVGVTARSIERNLKKLQDEGRLRRIGPAKGGHWEVIK